jgi:hypothetical protein
MLALFEVLSFKGWLDVRDVLIKVLGPVSEHQLEMLYMFVLAALVVLSVACNSVSI